MAWVPVLPALILPHQVVTLKINLMSHVKGTYAKAKAETTTADNKNIEKNKRKTGSDVRRAHHLVTQALVQQLLVTKNKHQNLAQRNGSPNGSGGGGGGGGGKWSRASKEATNWFLQAQAQGEAERERERHLEETTLLCALPPAEPEDVMGRGGPVKALAEGFHLLDFHTVGCICRVLSLSTKKDTGDVVLVLEGLARASVKSASIVIPEERTRATKGGGPSLPSPYEWLIMGHCTWPQPRPQHQMRPSIEDVRHLAEALYQVQRNILSELPTEGLGKLIKSLWQMSQVSQKKGEQSVPFSQVQVWATQVSDLLLASPLLDKLMSRAHRLEVLVAMYPKARVAVFTEILKGISNGSSLPLSMGLGGGENKRGSAGGSRSNRVGSMSKRSSRQHASDDGNEWDELEEKLESLPDGKLYREAMREFRRAKAASRMPPQPGDIQIRRWLECISEIPWQSSSDESAMDQSGKHILLRAMSIMDERHFGLKPVKKRIFEYLAVEQLRSLDKKAKDGPASILCLVGPPGVGKTSLAQTIAESLQRPMQRVSLGGVRDESEIRGHRRTYIGAMPGRIVQALVRAQSNRPVILLDEIDKAGNPGQVSVRGDPLGALLEVLDPEQNHAFVDHYVGHALDLSNVFFIATANSLQHMPPALRDRLEIVHLGAYTPAEKASIGTTHLWPKILRKHGLGANASNQVANVAKIENEVVEFIAENYTREAGVRQLERCLASICRHIACRVALDMEKRVDGKALGNASAPDLESKVLQFNVTQSLVEEVLGAPKVSKASYRQLCKRLETPGVASGLAWTSSGVGTVQLVECCSIKSSRQGGEWGNAFGRLTLTGQLGEVLEESAQIALTWVRSMCSQFESMKRIPFYEEAMYSDIHVHLPAGSVPKDGPSAGVTIVVALTSLFFGTHCRADTAMTGEISLTGNVLAVGGVAEKVRAAQKIGISRVIVPAENQGEARKALRNTTSSSASRNNLTKVEIIPVRSVDEAIEAAIVGGNPWTSFADQSARISPAVAKL